MHYLLRVYDGDLVLEETGDHTFESAERDGHWAVTHDGATRAEVVRDNGTVAKTLLPTADRDV